MKSELISERHLARRAVIYIRQSTARDLDDAFGGFFGVDIQLGSLLRFAGSMISFADIWPEGAGQR
jgi:hypothetical protein